MKKGTACRSKVTSLDGMGAVGAPTVLALDGAVFEVSVASAKPDVESGISNSVHSVVSSASVSSTCLKVEKVVSHFNEVAKVLPH